MLAEKFVQKLNQTLVHDATIETTCIKNGIITVTFKDGSVVDFTIPAVKEPRRSA